MHLLNIEQLHNHLVKQECLSAFQLLFTGAARDFDFNGWGNSEAVWAINYLQFDPLFEGQTTNAGGSICKLGIITPQNNASQNIIVYTYGHG